MKAIETAKSRIEKFPYYRRSPRVIIEVPEVDIEIEKPDKKSNFDRSSLVQIIVTPLTMILTTVLMTLVMKRSLFFMIGLMSVLVSSFFSVKKYLKKKNEFTEKNKQREDIYTSYLLDKRKELYENYELEKKSYKYNSPKLSSIEKMINEFNSRIYEKSAYDADFLSVTVGYYDSKIKSKIKYEYDSLKIDKDELELEAKELIEEYENISDVPLEVDLMNTNLGLVGKKDIIHEQLHILLAKLCFSRSYHDVEIILLINKKDYPEFRYTQWYPHLNLETMGVSGLISEAAVADQILLSMHKIIKERAIKEDNKSKDIKYAPHFIFIIDDARLISDHIIMEYLSKDISYGFSLIYSSNMQENLPENVQTIIKYKDKNTGELVLDNRIKNDKIIKLDSIGSVNLEWMARNLSILIHEQGLVMHLPDSISFFEMYGVKHPLELGIENLWNTNRPNKSLAVPLGRRATGENLMLNLHEKAHGPHGLIAGTTGSGKSEIIQTYILSLAVNFHPYDVAFLLIDYKGGGMANLFKDLPHVLGTITNLDKSESMRALVSIKSELNRRQAIFAENGVNHINDYSKLFKEGAVEEPLPHLFIISDEFAELKKEQPDFMTELVSTARLGRSLGIHLILATQKPSGVVTDQIWSNSRFKLALKVQDDSDSKEIIKTADAAYIRQPGRAYLQVGNNEIYELFQSAYSGAMASVELNEEVVDDRVYIRNFLGQMDLLNDDLDRKSSSSSIKMKSQLELTISYINKIYSEKEHKMVKKTWLPSLKEQYLSPEIQSKVSLLRDGSSNLYEDVQVVDLSVDLGLVDLPQIQSQEIYNVDFRKNGNLFFVSAAGYGKSTTLMTIAMTLAVKSPASLLNIYVLDFGNGNLLPLKNLPHVADYMSYEDDEKIGRFVQILNDEVKRRKNLLSANSAINFDMYNRAATEKLPAIVVMVDNIEIGKEINEELPAFCAQIARDGNNIGIYMVVTASASNAFRISQLNYFKTKIAMFLFDKYDITNIVGRTNIEFKEIKGRAYVKLDEAVEMQMYCVADMSDEDTYVDSVKDMITLIDNSYIGTRPSEIAIMPREFNVSIFENYITRNRDNQNDRLIPIGLDTENVKVSSINIDNKLHLFVGGPVSGRTNLLKVLLHNIVSDYDIYVIDDRLLALKQVAMSKKYTYITGPDDYRRFFDNMKNLIQERKDLFKAESDNNPELIPGEFYAKLRPIVVVISELESFVSNLELLNKTEYNEIMLRLSDVNICLIVSSVASGLRGYDNFTKFVKESVNGVVTGSASAQSVYSISRKIAVNEKMGIGYLIEKNSPVQIMIPEYK